MAQENMMRVGWREWLALPQLGLPAIKAKVDTGARTSALHAFQLEPFRRRGREFVCFAIHPLQRRSDVVVTCTAEIIDRRVVTDSGGHRELRYVIRTPIRLGGREWPVEVTLTSRDTMMFRMLLGRTSMEGHLLVEPHGSYLTGRPDVKGLYGKSAGDGEDPEEVTDEDRYPIAE